jgi:hypothetical protein
MGLAQQLRLLDDRAFGSRLRLPRAAITMLPPVPHADGTGPLSILLARQERTAARRIPEPRRTAASGVLVVTCNLALGALYGVILGRESHWFYAEVGLLWLLAAALNGVQVVHSYRFAVVRAAAIYGPDWHRLSDAERTSRWRDYCAQWWAWSQPPVVAPVPLDDGNPYATPSFAAYAGRYEIGHTD